MSESSKMSSMTDLSFSAAMSEFKSMFPDIDSHVIEVVMKLNDGDVDACINQLLNIDFNQLTEIQELANNLELLEVSTASDGDVCSSNSQSSRHSSVAEPIRHTTLSQHSQSSLHNSVHNTSQSLHSQSSLPLSLPRGSSSEMFVPQQCSSFYRPSSRSNSVSSTLSDSHHPIPPSLHDNMLLSSVRRVLGSLSSIHSDPPIHHKSTHIYRLQQRPQGVSSISSTGRLSEYSGGGGAPETLNLSQLTDETDTHDHTPLGILTDMSDSALLAAPTLPKPNMSPICRGSEVKHLQVAIHAAQTRDNNDMERSSFIDSDVFSPLAD